MDIFCDGRSSGIAEDRLWENSMEADGVEDEYFAKPDRSERW